MLGRGKRAGGVDQSRGKCRHAVSCIIAVHAVSTYVNGSIEATVPMTALRSTGKVVARLACSHVRVQG